MAQPIRTLLAVEDGLDADDFVRLLSGDDAIRLDSVVPGLDRAAAALETQQLDIVVIACRGFSDRAVFLVDRAVRLDPDRPVILLADGSPAGFVRRIFELGAEDILPLPQSGEQVRFAIHKTVQRRLGSNAASGQDNARIVAVLGPKGGTGKTLTSTNLAVVLAQRGQRVILIDLDLQFGDVGLTLGLPPDISVYNLAMAGGTIDADKIDAYIVDHPSGARALLAPSRPDQASSVTPHLLQEIYTALRPNYDYIVVDTPPGFTAEVITTIDVSTDLVMVGMLDSLSLKNTKLGPRDAGPDGVRPEVGSASSSTAPRAASASASPMSSPSSAASPTSSSRATARFPAPSTKASRSSSPSPTRRRRRRSAPSPTSSPVWWQRTQSNPPQRERSSRACSDGSPAERHRWNSTSVSQTRTRSRSRLRRASLSPTSRTPSTCR